MNVSLKEMARREQDGLEVTLFWDARSNEVSIQVIDRRSESTLWAPVAGRLALDAFHHPYTYLLTDDCSRERISATRRVATS